MASVTRGVSKSWMRGSAGSVSFATSVLGVKSANWPLQSEEGEDRLRWLFDYFRSGFCMVLGHWLAFGRIICLQHLVYTEGSIASTNVSEIRLVVGLEQTWASYRDKR